MLVIVKRTTSEYKEKILIKHKDGPIAKDEIAFFEGVKSELQKIKSEIEHLLKEKLD